MGAETELYYFIGLFRHGETVFPIIVVSNVIHPDFCDGVLVEGYEEIFKGHPEAFAFDTLIAGECVVGQQPILIADEAWILLLQFHFLPPDIILLVFKHQSLPQMVYWHGACVRSAGRANGDCSTGG